MFVIFLSVVLYEQNNLERGWLLSPLNFNGLKVEAAVENFCFLLMDGRKTASEQRATTTTSNWRREGKEEEQRTS